MSDETQTETTQTEETKSGKVVFESQADFNAVIQNRLAKEKAKYSDYDELKATVDKLTTAQKEREEQEMSDLQKAQKALEDKDKSITELTAYKDKWTAYEQRSIEAIQETVKDYPEEDKNIVDALIGAGKLEEARLAANKLVVHKEGATFNGKGTSTPNRTLAEIFAMPRGAAREKAYADYRKKL